MQGSLIFKKGFNSYEKTSTQSKSHQLESWGDDFGCKQLQSK